MKSYANFTLILLVNLLVFLININLNAQTRKPELIVQTGHSLPVNSIAFSPDSKVLASASRDKTIKLWNVETGNELRSITSSSFIETSEKAVDSSNAGIKKKNIWVDDFFCVVFSPDGKILASGGNEGIIILWDVETGLELKTFNAQSRADIYAISFSNDGKKLVAGDNQGEIRIWNIENSQELQLSQVNLHEINSIHPSPDGKVFAVQDNFEGVIELWDFSTGKKLQTLTAHKDEINSISFSADGKILAGANKDKTIKLWDVETGKELKRFSLSDEEADSISINPDGKTLASADTSSDLIKIRDIATGMPIQTFDAKDVDSILFSPNGKILASRGGNSIKLWDVEGVKPSTKLLGHKGYVNSVTYSPNGKILASGSDDETIKLWNTENQTEIRTLNNGSTVSSVAFGTDGKTLASAGNDGLIKIWDVETGNKLKSFGKYPEIVEQIAFNETGNILASAGNYGTVTLWNAATGTEIMTVKESKNPIAFTPDGKFFASVHYEDNFFIKLYSMETGQEIKTFKGHSKSINSIAFSPDGKILASGSDDKTVDLWDIETGNELRRLTGASNEIKSIAFSPDGKTLAGSNFRTIKIWDVMTGNEIRNLIGDSETVLSLAFSPDGKTLASGTSDKAIKLWNLTTVKSEILQNLRQHTFTLNSLTFSPNGKLLAVGSDDKTIKIWELEGSAELHTLTDDSEITSNQTLSVAFSPDGKNIAKGELSSPSRIFEVESGKEVKTFAADSFFYSPAEFSPNGKIFATIVKNSVKLWDVETGNELQELVGHTNDVNSVSFNFNGERIASGSDDGTVKIWETITGKLLNTLIGHDSQNVFIGNDKIFIKGKKVKGGDELKPLIGDAFGVNSVKFSSDGKFLASGNKSGTVRLWDAETGKELNVLSGHSRNIESVTFSADGRILASGSRDKTIKLWDTSTGKELKTLKGHDDYVNSIAISPNSKFLVSASTDNTVKIWDVMTGKELCSLIAIDQNDWLVTTPEGLFDGSPNAWKQVIWRFDNNTFNYAPVEAYFNDFFYPNLLQDILQGKHPLPSEGKDLSKIDRRTPLINLALADSTDKATANSARTVKIKIEIKTNSEKPKTANQPVNAGARDVRLFRNSSLVKIWHGDVLKDQESAILETDVSLVAGDNKFTAYAFNHDNVKSEDSTITIKDADSLKRMGTLYVLAIGINKYENPAYNLNFAVSDVNDISNNIKFNQEKLSLDIKLKQYLKTEIVTLADQNATKANILLALKRFSKGNQNIIPQNADSLLKQELLKIKPSQPEDAVIIYYAGHGTSRGERFYLLPHNFTGNDENVLIKDGLSDIELNDVLEQVDVGKLLMVIDACQSGQALGKEGEGRAPMNSKGLAQLAYDKGMLILTAAQSQQAALEVVNINGKEIRHGLLTYALLQGFTAPEANKDGNNQLWDRKWFDYAVNEVPKLQLQVMKQRHVEIGKSGRGAEIIYVNGDKNTDPNKRALQTPRIFYRREAETNPLIIARGN